MSAGEVDEASDQTAVSDPAMFTPMPPMKVSTSFLPTRKSWPSVGVAPGWMDVTRTHVRSTESSVGVQPVWDVNHRSPPWTIASRGRPSMGLMAAPAKAAGAGGSPNAGRPAATVRSVTGLIAMLLAARVPVSRA